MRSKLASLASLLSICASPATAFAAPDEADEVDEADESVVRPSTRPFVVNLGLGPSIGVVGCNEDDCDTASSFNQFKLTQDFGYHFWEGGEGPALGFSIEEAFGDHLLRIEPGVKFWWDIQPSDTLGLYIAPFVKIGYAYLEYDLGPFGSISDNAFNAQAGVALHLALADRAQLLLRPVAFDMLANDDGMAVTYDITAGGGVTF
jgi:hypothetical protein